MIHLIIWYLKNHIYWYHHQYQKSFRYFIEKLISSQSWIQIFQSSNFRLNSQSLSLATNTVIYSHWNDKFSFLYLRNVCQIPKSNNSSSYVSCSSSKNDVPLKMCKFRSQLSHMWFSLRQPSRFGYASDILYLYFLYHPTEYQNIMYSGVEI